MGDGAHVCASRCVTRAVRVLCVHVPVSLRVAVQGTQLSSRGFWDILRLRPPTLQCDPGSPVRGCGQPELLSGRAGAPAAPGVETPGTDQGLAPGGGGREGRVKGTHLLPGTW